MVSLSQQLDEVVDMHFENGRQKASQRINDAMAPYTRFVKVETDRVAELKCGLTALRQDITEIKNKIR